MQRILYIIAIQISHTYQNKPINTDEWFRLRAETNGNAVEWLNLRSHKTYTILGTVSASSRDKVKKAADAFIGSAAYMQARKDHGIEHQYPEIKIMDVETLAAAINDETAKHADLDQKLAKEINRRERWNNPVNTRGNHSASE